MSMPQIVTVNVTQDVAPTPSTLQKTGAFVSQGATITSPGTLSLLTQYADLTPLLRGARALTSQTWSGGVVTATATVPHGYPIGSEIELTISGTVPTSYNGTYLCRITGASTFTYARANSPGSVTTPGAYTPEDVAELVAMASTFFAQGSSVAVYVIELGAGSIEEGVAALTDYLNNNPFEIYSFLVPRTWDANSDFLALIAQHTATTAKLYFWVTTTLQTRGVYTDQMKDVFALIEAPQQHVYQGNDLTGLDYTGEHFALSAVWAARGTEIEPGDVLVPSAIADDPPSFTVTRTTVATIVVNAGGTSGTPGPVAFSGTTGTGTVFTATGDIDGSGALVDPLVLTFSGSYSVNPDDLVEEPVVGGGLVGATVTIVMGVLVVSVTDRGAVHVVPPNPVAMIGSDATLNITWQVNALSGLITATTATNHGVTPGDLFQIAGCVPGGYNTYYVALPDTSGDTLVASLYTDPGLPTVLGSLVGSTTESGAPPSVEFTLAAPFWNALHISPSTTNKVAPFAFQYVFGVTNWVTKGRGALLQTLKDEGVGYITTGAEGGISNSCIFWGMLREVPRDFTYWYSIDWAQINTALNLANAIINGSNNPINPLYFDQAGIDRLQDAAVATMQTAVSVGLANGVPARSSLDGPDFTDALENGKFDGKIVVNAIPFLEYLRVNPSDYKIGRYAGLSVVYIPNRGFISIVFNIHVTDFLVA